MDTQKEMDQAFDTYLSLSYALSEDFDQFLDTETESEGWRRNYIRIAVALIEGYSNCFRSMTRIGLTFEHSKLSAKEKRVLEMSEGFSTSDRIKYTLRAIFRMFDLSSAPAFDGNDWQRAINLIDKRHSITHPTKPDDLQIINSSWIDYRMAAAWLMKCHFDVAKLLHEKYVR